MSENQPQELDLSAIILFEHDASNKGMQSIRYLSIRLQEAQRNPNLHKEQLYKLNYKLNPLLLMFKKRELAL